MEIPISLWCGMIPRWKKRTFVLEKEGYKIYEKKENGVIIDKDCRLISLFGGKVINNNNLEFTIETSSAINMIKANTMKEKTILIEKIEETIRRANESNAFSKDFISYSDEITKMNNSTTFNSVEVNISFMQNCILAMTTELNEFRNQISGMKLNFESKSKLIACHTNLFCIEERLKRTFNEMVRFIYDYKEENDNRTNGHIIEEPKKDTNIITTTVETKQKIEFTDPIYSFEKRLTLPHPLSVNKNLITDMIKAATSKQRTLPIYFNEPISFLQKDCEKFFYCNYLSSAASQQNLEKKMLYLASFIIGEISFNTGRILKPFMPLIGETFEYFDNERKYRYFSEQVSRRPQHISAYIAEGKKWKMYGDNRNTNSFKFLKGCVELEFGSKVHIELYNEETKKWETFIFNKPTTQMKGILTKILHYDFTGKITLSCVTNKDIVCEISFYEERKDSPIGKFDGKITNKDEVVYLLGGNWKQELWYTDKDGNNKETLLTIEQQKFFENNFEGYVMPDYTLNFNVLNDELKKVLPICDSRYRPDQREYENGNIEKSQEIKNILENKQVKRQEIFDKDGYEYKPNYFENEFSEDSGDFVYLYKGGYWEDRAKLNYKHLTDIFKLDEGDDVKQEGK